MKSLTRLFFLLLSCMCLLGACKEEEEYVYPNVITEFIGAATDESGTLTHLVADNGEEYRIQARNGLSGLKKDTLYRTISIYQPLEDQTVQLYSSELVLSMIPVSAKQIIGGIKTDPVDIERMWLSGKYLNMVLLAKVKEESHSYHFIDQGIQKEADGTQTLHLQLYHNRNNDYEAFTRKVYLSVPLWAYDGKLKQGDKIVFHISTYEEGDTQREFIY